MTKVDNYPQFMAIKQGKIIFTETDWPAVIGFKWGSLEIGTGAVVARDTNHKEAGSGAISMTTGNVTGDLAEIKTTIPYSMGEGKIALEMKWSPALNFGANEFHMGIEPRIAAVGFLQGRVRYRVDTDEWQYETGVDTYTAFDPTVVVKQPTLDSAAGGGGDQYGWVRLVIDIAKREYVSFEAAGKGKKEYRDMRGIPLVNRGVTTDDILLFFGLGITGANANEEFFTTDWAATVVE